MQKFCPTGVYAILAQNPRTVDEMLKICGKKILNGKKDESGAVWEVAVLAESKKLTSGGTAADDEACRQGYVAHMVTSSENRWCIPEHLLQLKALWVRDGSLQALSCTNASLRL